MGWYHKITTEKGDFVNNNAANSKLVKDKVAPGFSDGRSMVDMLGGQNPIKAWSEAAEKIDLSNATYADAQIKMFVNDAADMYCEGEFSTVDEALAFIKKETKKAFDLK